MKTLVVLAIAGALAAGGSAFANDRLVQDKQCLGCHEAKADAAAPSFARIAQFWKGRPEAEARMIATIRQGSTGTGGPHWNKATMPDQAERPLVSEAEARQIARWLLSR